MTVVRTQNLDPPASGEEDGFAERSPFERVYRGVVRGVYEGRYVPGQRLAAPDLMREYDVGRGTVREVLHRLASTGVVTIIPNRSAMVRMFSRRETHELMQIVELLLGLAARQAAAAVGAGADLRALKSAFDRLAAYESLDDFHGFIEAREAYYRHVVDLSANKELRRLFPSVQVHIMRIQLRHYARSADSMQVSDYAVLTDAILAGDQNAAELAARAHVRNTLDKIDALPNRAFLEAG